MDYNSKKYAEITGKPNKKIFREILKYLDPQPEDRILEIGSGRGFFVKKMLSFSKNVIGIDLNPWAVALKKCSNVKLMDATKLDFPPGSFDKIYSSHTIEHISDLEKFFKELERVLRPKGKVVLIYPFEVIRGLNVLKDAILIFRNPFRARSLHLHKLNPSKIKKFIKGSKLSHSESHLIFTPFPNYLTVLVKN